MGSLAASNRTGCIGEDYIQLLCSSAGISCSPNRQGQDVDAVDFTINYGSFPQQIQVKCTQKPKRVTYQKKNIFHTQLMRNGTFSGERVFVHLYLR